MSNLATLDRQLATTRLTFNQARTNLQAALHSWLPRDGSVNALIYKAEEYGVDHAVKLLQTQPEIIGFTSAPAYRPDLTRLLTTAYEASLAVDLAMGAREDALAAANPHYRKAVLVADREVEVDVSAGTLYDRVTRNTIRDAFRRIDTDAQYDNDRGR